MISSTGAAVALGASTGTAGAAARAARGPRTGVSNSGSLYYLDANGKLAMTRVKTGINDGTETEITGNNITDGTKVIAGTVSTTQTATTTTKGASPFGATSTQQQRGGGRGGF